MFRFCACSWCRGSYLCTTTSVFLFSPPPARPAVLKYSCLPEWFLNFLLSHKHSRTVVSLLHQSITRWRFRAQDKQWLTPPWEIWLSHLSLRMRLLHFTQSGSFFLWTEQCRAVSSENLKSVAKLLRLPLPLLILSSVSFLVLSNSLLSYSSLLYPPEQDEGTMGSNVERNIQSLSVMDEPLI